MASNSIQGLGRSTVNTRRRERVQAHDHGETPAAKPESQALVPVGARPRTDDPVFKSKYTRPNAAYLAQLIATRDGHPQTRTRRRASDAAGNALYRATDRVTLPLGTGLTLRRSA